MMHHDPVAPTYLGGTFDFDGGHGCWLTDVDGLLDDGFDGRPRLAAYVAWRRGRTVGAKTLGNAPDIDDVRRRLGAGDTGWGHDLGLPLFLGQIRYSAKVAAGDYPLPECKAPHVPTPERAARKVANLSTALAALRPFLDTLDPEAVRACAEDVWGPMDDAEYAGFDLTLDPERTLMRAVGVLPHMRGALAEAHETDPAAMAAALPNRDALLGLLRDDIAMRHGGRTASAAIRVEALYAGLDADGRRQADSGFPHHADLPFQAAADLCRLPMSWWPQTGAEFLDFAACHPAVSHATKCAAEGMAGALLNVRGDWAGFRLRLSKACGLSGPILPDDLRRCLHDVDDMAASFVRQVVVPALALSGMVDPARRGPGPRVVDERGIARNILQEGRTVAATLEASLRWHGARWRIANALPGRDAVPNRWAAGMPADRRDGIDVVPLTDAAALEAEGAPGTDADGVEGLNHCVGGHAGACMAGTSRVVSLRTVRGGHAVRLSTAEFRPGPRGPELVQHRGRDNGEPQPAAVAAIKGYVADIARGRLAVDPAGWEPVRGGDRVTLGAGYDWMSEGNWRAVLALWAPYAPKPLRGMAPADVARLASDYSPGQTSRAWRGALTKA